MLCVECGALGQIQVAMATGEWIKYTVKFDLTGNSRNDISGFLFFVYFDFCYLCFSTPGLQDLVFVTLGVFTKVIIA